MLKAEHAAKASGQAGHDLNKAACPHKAVKGPKFRRGRFLGDLTDIMSRFVRISYDTTVFRADRSGTEI